MRMKALNKPLTNIVQQFELHHSYISNVLEDITPGVLKLKLPFTQYSPTVQHSQQATVGFSGLLLSSGVSRREEMSGPQSGAGIWGIENTLLCRR